MCLRMSRRVLPNMRGPGGAGRCVSAWQGDACAGVCVACLHGYLRECLSAGVGRVHACLGYMRMCVMGKRMSAYGLRVRACP